MAQDYSYYEKNRLRYDADRLWKQGIQSIDKTIIMLMYGYSEREARIICDILADRERAVDNYLKYYNPDLSF